jgi:hypothetical protein
MSNVDAFSLLKYWYPLSPPPPIHGLGPRGVVPRRCNCAKHEARLPSREHEARAMLPVLPK